MQMRYNFYSQTKNLLRITFIYFLHINIIYFTGASPRSVFTKHDYLHFLIMFDVITKATKQARQQRLNAWTCVLYNVKYCYLLGF